MSTPAFTFDTHKFVKRLVDSGFTEQQAEVLADEQTNLINSNLATTLDIEEVKRNIKELEGSLRTDIKELELRLTDSQKEMELRLVESQKDLELRLTDS